ncbi:unnamed protein product [marine sediment metagenome]|uniref:SWIM-type domain-containing protein n=1 Tax=marine sediment metagenome TaxID=412755 RepID=X1P8F7_9ZZZZ
MQIISKEPLIGQMSFEVIQKRKYTVRQRKDKLVCNCPGFTKWGTCCHVKEMEELIKE